MTDMSLLSKNGNAVVQLAREFIKLRPGSRLETIGDYAARLDMGRGTVQTAIKFMTDAGAIKLEARGHLGTFVEEIHYEKLWHLCGFMSLTGVMPLPYSRRYEGLATGIYRAFEKANIPFNMAYMRGGSRRLEALKSGKYDFVVMSKLAADYCIANGHPLRIAVRFGKYSYVKGHNTLFANPQNKEIVDGMKVAIDSSSLDHYLLTHYECENKAVTFVELTYNQIMKKLQQGTIDAAVWNIDEILDQGSPMPFYPTRSKKVAAIDEADTEAVMVVRSEGGDIAYFLQSIIDVDLVTKIQQAVLQETMLPQY